MSLAATRPDRGLRRAHRPRRGSPGGRTTALIGCLALVLAGLVAHALPASAASAARSGVVAYVANSGSNTVSVIDTTTNTTTATIPVGRGPYGLAANHAGTRVYVADFDSAGISVIDTAGDTVTATIATGGAPFAMAVDPSDARLYVAQGNSVLVIDTGRNAVTATIPVGTNPIAVLVAPDGAHAYAVNNAGRSVSVISTATATVTATIALPGSPDGAALAPDGTHLYAVDNQTGLWILDLTTGGTLTTTVPIADASNVAVNASGTRAYVSAFPAAVKVVDLTTDTVIDSVPVGNYPANLTLHVAGRFVYTTNSASGDVTVIDTTTDTVVATVPVGKTPYGIVVVGVPQPRTVTAVRPNSGPASGGTAVTITGTHFTGSTAVTFGATPAGAFTVVDDTTITATAPPGAPGTVDITVTGPGGSSPASPADRYTYVATPADVAVDLQATGVPSLFDAHLDYLVSITNKGPGTLSSATVTAPLPAPMTATSPDCAVTGGRTVTCTVGPLAKGATATRHFTSPVGLLSLGVDYAVTATRVASTPADPNPANDSSSTDCTVLTSLLILCS
ncbi:IPT/TIG domain-containing protein [Embleya sp. AB8]|uniref:IPT/TIG domain-containing protein n=1 Tax=Embleya sp. AB8 TaxID=3156304 RepID=UPI003C78CBED